MKVPTKRSVSNPQTIPKNRIEAEIDKKIHSFGLVKYPCRGLKSPSKELLHSNYFCAVWVSRAIFIVFMDEKFREKQ